MTTTQVIQRVEVTLRSFYVFNSDFGQKEGEEHRKVLYYFPNDIELNTKIKDVGLSEAIIAFTGTFINNDGSCKALHTQKTTQLFYQPEPGYWMVLVINVPKEIRTKDGVEVADYRGSEVHDRIYRSVLEQCYSMFRLFSGTFRMNLDGAQGEAAREQLQQRLGLFFDKFLLSLKLSACDIMDMTRSIQYLALNKLIFLRAHNFINMIRATFPAIAETILLYNEQVVCSGKLDPIDLYSLYEYVVGTLLKRTPTELGSAVLARSNSTVADAYRNGAFITGPEDDEHATEPPKVYLAGQHPDTLQAYHLIVYRAMNATLCLFVPGHEELPQNDFYVELHSYVGPQLISIARDIGETVKQRKQSSPLSTSVSTAGTDINASDVMTPKYLFINEQSLKHLSNISIDRDHRRLRVAPSIPTDVMNVIADMANDDAAPDNCNATASFEVQVKTTNDFWIVKRRCNWRQYYVIIFNSKATLLDVTNEAKRLFEQELTDDVFFDK